MMENNNRLEETKILIVKAKFNEAITQSLLMGALDACREFGLSTHHIKVVEVAGAVEIPIVLKRLLSASSSSDNTSTTFSGAVALGCVVRGSTPHFDYVCEQASVGIQRVSLEVDLPITFGILTTDNFEQAIKRSGFHKNKGYEAAEVLFETLNVL